MKKVLNKKLLGGKVFQRHSTRKSNVDSLRMTEDPSAEEIESLRTQVKDLTATVDSLKLDIENKEIKLAKLARDKEKLSMNLAKTKRSTENLTRQLEDERNFYYKETEMYCHEMNECKKLKKAISNSNLSSGNGEEIGKLKKTLEHTLRTNYNLCVKFLRMKETKKHLSNILIKSEEDYKKVVNNLKVKIVNLRDELKEILNQNLDDSLSPSSKKFIQVVNRNSSLVYENLQLQMQLDQLKFKMKRNKIHKTRSETSSRTNKEKVIKIFEKEKSPDLPTLTILKEKEVRLHSSERKLQLPEVNESKLELFQVSGVHSQSSVGERGVRKRSRSAPKIVQSVRFTMSGNEGAGGGVRY